ncbi:MAG: hypothetical protein QM662_18445 [Gordonia sp. (in: high G+C Gram-positive bacteria)]
MSSDPDDLAVTADTSAGRARRAARRRRTIDEVFGDDLAEAIDDRRGQNHSEFSVRDYEHERPPHYD